MADLKTTAEERDIPTFRRNVDTHTFQSLALVAYDALQDVNTLLAENAKLRAVAEAAREYREMESPGLDMCRDNARDALDAALAALEAP